MQYFVNPINIGGKGKIKGKIVNPSLEKIGRIDLDFESFQFKP